MPDNPEVCDLCHKPLPPGDWLGLRLCTKCGAQFCSQCQGDSGEMNVCGPCARETPRPQFYRKRKPDA